MRTVAVIPARLESKRLPRKILADIGGWPLLWHVWKQVIKARLLDEVCIATDSNEIRDAVEAWGGNAIMTSAQCRSGTDRIANLVGYIRADLIVNVQGDEPSVCPQLLDELVTRWRNNRSDMITPIFSITQVSDLLSPDTVKVVVGGDGRALYFSRSPIPHIRGLSPDSWLARHAYWGHLGVYGYRMEALAAFARLPTSPLEAAERLEQLRFLEAGYRIETFPTEAFPLSINTLEDLERARTLMCS